MCVALCARERPHSTGCHGIGQDLPVREMAGERNDPLAALERRPDIREPLTSMRGLGPMECMSGK